MRVFFSVGEPSGDQHAAALIRELRRREPSLQAVGFGGSHMQQAGCECLYPLTNLAVMGIVAVLPLLWQFYKLVRQARQHFEENRPDAVILVDFPGFNWWIARRAKAAGIPVFYYMPPQLWAWAPWRIKKVRRFVDVVLSGLPFEAQWYRERGIDAQYVGHPFFDEVAAHVLDPEICRRVTAGARRVALLPGSRNQEVKRNWPVMLDVVRQVAAQNPDVRFPVACYKPQQRDYCEQTLRSYEQTIGHSLPLDFHLHSTSEIIETADCCLFVSGSVSLEVLARGKAAVVLYRTGVIFGIAALCLLNCRYISLPNLVAGRELFPEFAFDRWPKQRAARMAVVLNTWLADPATLAERTADVQSLREEVLSTGGIATAAETILHRLPTVPHRAAA